MQDCFSRLDLSEGKCQTDSRTYYSRLEGVTWLVNDMLSKWWKVLNWGIKGPLTYLRNTFYFTVCMYYSSHIFIVHCLKDIRFNFEKLRQTNILHLVLVTMSVDYVVNDLTNGTCSEKMWTGYAVNLFVFFVNCYLRDVYNAKVSINFENWSCQDT